MSLILDALNRADNERKNQAPLPDLNTRHNPLALEPEQASSYWRWWLPAPVFVLIILVVVWRWYSASQPGPVTAASVQEAKTSAASSQAIAPEPVAKPSPAIAARVTEAPQVESTGPVGSLTAVSGDGEKVASSDIQNLYADETDAPAVIADTDVKQLYAAEESVGSESIVDPFVASLAPDATPVPSEVEREPARTFANSPAQDFNELPWNTKQKMPTISYQRHDYLAGGISSVVINGQTLGVGNIVATGQFVVQDILVDGVVLKHGDRVFKLRALNGWINM
uniref:general secretion pathway protein GspB n=1 Tax=Cellvibrio fontiphilus TaxID=1815559 RepID=UPI002B4BC7E3|nr:general secretion pathway protein GspB [Cellvibrio fontiphilus]